VKKMPRTVKQGFDLFIKRLQPLESEYKSAASHRKSILNSLRNHLECSKLFETGSFGNETSIRHFSDVDYFAVFPAVILKSHSGNALREIKEKLNITFWNTFGIEVSCPSVRIPFGQYASEDIEITPAEFRGLTQTPLGKFASYHIPDCQNEWHAASPEAHNKYVSVHDNRLDGKLKPFIRLVKAWKYFNDVPLLSFYLELRATRFSENINEITFDFHLRDFFLMLERMELSSIRDPMGVSGLIPPAYSEAKLEKALSKITTARSRAEKAAALRERNPDKAFHYWNLFFNKELPSR
jgi:hypothetical protein